jgi:hypothetical protein
MKKDVQLYEYAYAATRNLSAHIIFSTHHMKGDVLQYEYTDASSKQTKI